MVKVKFSKYQLDMCKSYQHRLMKTKDFENALEKLFFVCKGFVYSNFFKKWQNYLYLLPVSRWILFGQRLLFTLYVESLTKGR